MKQGPLIPNIKMPPSRICSLPWASLVAQLVKNPPAMRETWVWSLGWDGPLVKRKATHSSILAWRIPWTVWSCGCKVSDTTERLSLSECTPIKTWWGGYVAGSILKHFPAVWLLMPVLLCFTMRITWDLMNKTHTAPHLTPVYKGGGDSTLLGEFKKISRLAQRHSSGGDWCWWEHFITFSSRWRPCSGGLLSWAQDHTAWRGRRSREMTQRMGWWFPRCGGHPTIHLSPALSDAANLINREQLPRGASL